MRRASRRDLPAINAIYNHYVLNSTCTYQTELSTMKERRAWFDAHKRRHPVLVVEEDGEVIGWASLSAFHPRAGYRHSVENSIYVRNDHLRRGLGSMLLKELIRLARALRHRTVIALISADQRGSLRLHRKFGFVDAGRLRSVGNKFDRWLDVAYLQLLL